jgi:hypothetical protein
MMNGRAALRWLGAALLLSAALLLLAGGAGWLNV